MSTALARVRRRREGPVWDAGVNDQVTAAAKPCVSTAPQVLNSSLPPGAITRRISPKADGLSGKNMTPNWQITRSNCRSSKGRQSASACRHAASGTRLDPNSTIAAFRSVAVTRAAGMAVTS